MDGDHFVLMTATPWDDRTEIIGVYPSESWAREAASTWLSADDRGAFPRCVIEGWSGEHRLDRQMIEGIVLDDESEASLDGPRRI